ncbi:hypothetical protein AB0H34_45740 [Saccharopolyspora shandongensis]
MGVQPGDLGACDDPHGDDGGDGQPLGEGARALAELAGGGQFGKLVLTIG